MLEKNRRPLRIYMGCHVTYELLAGSNEVCFTSVHSIEPLGPD